MTEDSKWASTTQVAQHFGLNPKELRSLIPELESGRHYIDIAAVNAARSTYRFSIVELEQYFSIRRYQRGEVV